MRFVLVEDDPNQVELLRDHLQAKFAAEVKVEKSVYQFSKALPDLILKPPDLIILDVMLPWLHRDDPDADPPDDVNLDDFHLGVLCMRWLTADTRLRKQPIILFTELQNNGEFEEDIRSLPSNVIYLRKDSKYEELDRTIANLIHRKP